MNVEPSETREITPVDKPRLFDPKPFTRPGVTPHDERTARQMKPAPDTVPVVISALWRLVVAKQPGVLHAVKSGPDPFGAYRTACGKTGSARTFDEGVAAHGCIACSTAVENRRAG